MEAHLDDPLGAPDRRGGGRRALRLEAGAEKAGEPVNAVVLNLSESGLLLETQAPLAPGEALDVVLPEAGTRTARVVWAGHGLAGCKFDAPLGKAALSAATLRSEPVTESFSQRLRRLRNERGLTALQLCRYLGVSKPTLWNWETGRTSPQPRFLRALAEALEVSERELEAGGGMEMAAKAPAAPETRRTEAIEYHKGRIAELLDVEPRQIDIVVKF